MSSALLETRGLTVAFGGLIAVDKVDLKIESGEIHGIIGPNGSGKTTVLNVVSGIYRPTTGSVLFGGRNTGRYGPADLVKMGMTRTFQNIRLFPTLSVIDNVKVATYSQTRSGLASIFTPTRTAADEESRVDSAARDALSFVGLLERADDHPSDLPYGQQRLLELARAIVAEPTLILLDEPAAGMSLDEKRRLAGMIRELNHERQIAILVIEHDMRVISGLCHNVTALNFGKVIARGTPAEVRSHPDVLAAYLGNKESTVAVTSPPIPDGAINTSGDRNAVTA